MTATVVTVPQCGHLSSTGPTSTRISPSGERHLSQRT
jgi:hypothetical protein